MASCPDPGMAPPSLAETGLTRSPGRSDQCFLGCVQPSLGILVKIARIARMKRGIPMANRICFVELPTGTTGPTKSFYSDAFGFAMTDFGPTYSCTMTGDVDLGLQADAKEASRAPLPVIQVESLEATESLVKRAGGVITRATFSFPGGRRFHFRDPAGNELAAMQPD